MIIYKTFWKDIMLNTQNMGIKRILVHVAKDAGPQRKDAYEKLIS